MAQAAPTTTPTPIDTTQAETQKEAAPMLQSFKEMVQDPENVPKLMAAVRHSHAALSLAACIGCGFMMGTCFVSIFWCLTHELFSPIGIGVQIYFILFAFAGFVFEFPAKHKLLTQYREMIEREFKGFSKLFGRGLLYMSQGLLCTQAQKDHSELSMFIGWYFLLLGIACLVLSSWTASDMRAMKKTMVKNNQAVDLQKLFKDFDGDNDNYLDALEFKSLCIKLGELEDLSEAETELLMSTVTKDMTSGKISYAQFEEWWLSNDLTYV